MNFLLDLISGNVDEDTRAVLARYSRGKFEGPALDGERTSRTLKLNGSYLYTPVLAELLADRCDSDLKITGTIASNEEIDGRIEALDLEVKNKRKWRGYKYKVAGTLSPEGLRKLYEDLSDVEVLAKAKAKGFSLSPGSSVPKPKKFSDPSFCKLSMPIGEEAQLAAVTAVAPGIEPRTFDELSVRHTIEIEELVIPEELSDEPASVKRLKAKRKGVLYREISLDGEEMEDSFRFLA